MNSFTFESVWSTLSSSIFHPFLHLLTLPFPFIVSLPLPFTHTHAHSHTPSCFLDYCWRACLNALPAIGDEDEEEDTEAYEVQPPLSPPPPPPSPAPLSRESSCFTHRKTLSILSFIQRGEILFSPEFSVASSRPVPPLERNAISQGLQIL